MIDLHIHVNNALEFVPVLTIALVITQLLLLLKQNVVNRTDQHHRKYLEVGKEIH